MNWTIIRHYFFASYHYLVHIPLSLLCALTSVAFTISFFFFLFIQIVLCFFFFSSLRRLFVFIRIHRKLCEKTEANTYHFQWPWVRERPSQAHFSSFLFITSSARNHCKVGSSLAAIPKAIRQLLFDSSSKVGNWRIQMNRKTNNRIFPFAFSHQTATVFHLRSVFVFLLCSGS